MLHSGLNILKCMYCPTYLASKHIRGHLDKHDFPRPSADTLGAALELCKQHDVPSENWDCSLPYPGGPPVEEAVVDSFGLACHHQGCMYAVPGEKIMSQHQSDCHPGELPKYHSTAVQHLFAIPKRYFSVEPSLEFQEDSQEDADLTLHLLHNIIPTAVEAQPILTASDDRGRTPIEKHFSWDQLLLPIRKSRVMLTHLADLKKRHQAQEDQGIYVKLYEATTHWVNSVGQDLDGKPNRLDLERIMIHGGSIPDSE